MCSLSATGRSAPGSRTERSARSLIVGLAVVVVGGLALRAPLLPGYLENHDAVNFALALDGIDLSIQQPHFPGYPVYIAAARVLSAVGLSDPLALSLPGVLAGALAAALLFACVRARAGVVIAAGITALYLVMPGPWMADVTTMSDALGLHLLTACLCGLLLAPGRHGVLVGLGLGLLAGVRLSWAPLVPGALALLWLQASDTRRRLRALAGFCGGTLAWALPLVVIAGGPAALADLGLSFLHGHVTEWGNGATASADVSPSARALAWATNLTVFTLGPAALVGLAAVAVRTRIRRGGWALVAIGCPYLLWILLGQNPDNARHALPFVPLALLATVGALSELGARWPRRLGIALAAVAAVTFALTLPRVIAHARTLPPSLQLVEWVTAHHTPGQLQLYTGSEARLFQHYAPAFRATMVNGAADIERDLRERGGRPRTVLVTSTAGDLRGVRDRLVPVARFERTPTSGSRDNELVLYALTTQTTTMPQPPAEETP